MHSTTSPSRSFFKETQLGHRTSKRRVLCLHLPHESSPGNTFVTRPSNQRDLGTVLSITRTRSFTAKFLFFSSHLWRYCKVGTYSRTHRHQKQLARNYATIIISLSHTPDTWLAVGGWKRHLGNIYLNHSTLYECSSLLICSSFSSRTERRSSLSAPVKFVPLSDQISLGQP